MLKLINVSEIEDLLEEFDGLKRDEIKKRLMEAIKWKGKQ